MSEINKEAVCSLCPHHCHIAEGRTGLCRGRGNHNGIIVCENYGRLTALALDPIEKKPLARFYPGSRILSAGSYGCNLRCPFCQNHEISMAGKEIKTTSFPPELLIQQAIAAREMGNIGIAFTYNEPLISYEYIKDCAGLARKAGLRVVLVTNGMICKEPLLELLPMIDAMNIDLKGFTEEFYEMVGGDFETIKETIRLSAASCHVEITTLIIPGLNDDEREIDALAAFLAGIREDIPLHVTRFFPNYKMTDRGPTPVETVYHLRDVAAARLKYVYTGNC